MNKIRLNRRVEVYAKNSESEKLNELNQTTYDYVPYKKLWACIMPQTNKAYNAAAGTLAAEITHKIIMRYRSDITKDMYIKYNKRQFDIVAPPLDPYMSHEYIEISVTEVAE